MEMGVEREREMGVEGEVRHTWLYEYGDFVKFYISLKKIKLKPQSS